MVLINKETHVFRCRQCDAIYHTEDKRSHKTSAHLILEHIRKSKVHRKTCK